MRQLLCLALGSVLAVLAGNHDAYGQSIPVTSCGQAVEGVGVLTGDLDCSASSGPAVILRPGAKLDLAGFTLSATDVGVHCDIGRCLVRGPGTIKRPTYDGMSDNTGIEAFRRVRVLGVTLENWRRAVFVLGPADVRNCSIENGGLGVIGGPVSVTDSHFEGNAVAAVYSFESTRDGVHYHFYSAHVRRSTFADNDIDIASYKKPKVRETDCTTSAHLTVPPTPYGGGDEWNVCP